MLRTIAIAILGAFACAGQNFEVASIKPGVPPGSTGRFHVGMTRGGPASPDPGHFSCQNCTLMMLVTDAFDVKPNQVSGPSWMTTERFDITAKIPLGSTEDQVLVMEQNLLADRFKMSFHRESKEMPVYELVVGKGGPKFKEVPKGSTPSDPLKNKDEPPDAIERTSTGYKMQMRNGSIKFEANGESMPELAHDLWTAAGRPVIDATGLKGEYEFTLTFALDTPGARPASPPGSASVPDGDAGPAYSRPSRINWA